MKYKELLNEMCYDCKFYPCQTLKNGEHCCAFNGLAEVLEKQIPKKPSQNSVGLYYFPTCPNCHKELESYDHHCECRQALDWSGVNE